VLVVERGQALMRFGAGGGEPGDGAGAELVLMPPAQAPEGDRILLGTDAAGIAYFAVPGPLQDGAAKAGLREAGALLGDRDAGLLTHAVALANWHATHTHCPRCGARTRFAAAGHMRVCPRDGSEHFPRVDPAVIMLVLDSADRCLLARNQKWPQKRVSILAGFVEPGESVEQAVAREVREEVGISVGELRYLGSQPWPLPQSLMLGFSARAIDDGQGGQPIRVDDDEIAEAGWYGRDDLRVAIESGAILLPPPVSIAHRIIEAWYGAPLPGRW
jgi:NAD+ diphosphatase